MVGSVVGGVAVGGVGVVGSVGVVAGTVGESVVVLVFVPTTTTVLVTSEALLPAVFVAL